MLAPAPDFRYVGLVPELGQRARRAPSLAEVAAVAAFTGASGLSMGARGWALGLAVGVSAMLVASHVRAQLAEVRRSPTELLAIVPWGILIDPDSPSRVLRWPAVKRVNVETFHAQGGGSTSTLFSNVTVETEDERWAGQATGAVPLDRLLAYLDDYAVEQARPVALDLDGAVAGEGPTEPECESLLAAAHGFLGSAAGAARLDLPPGGYRTASARAASSRAVEVLRGVLRARDHRGADPRAFAAVIAAEIGARKLGDDVVALVQSPHPVIAAVAKQAARKLGVASQRAGALDEVTPFLRDEDALSLAAW